MIINENSLSQDPTDLCKIMSKHGSDKSMGWHNYTILYNELFKNIKASASYVFELGIGTINSGASLRGWKDYFNKANIYGADILYETLFTDHRIQTFYCDQLDKKSIEKLWSNFNSVLFDVILEDGLHTYEANIHFFENSFHKLRNEGFYIIEDVLVSEIPKYESYFKSCSIKFEKHQIVDLYNPGNKMDNVLIIIKK